MWFYKQDIYVLPHRNIAQLCLTFTHVTFLFIQGLSRLQEKVINLTFILFDAYNEW